MGRPRPTKVEAYECPTCGYLTKDRKEAGEHADKPLTSFPVGFVYLRPWSTGGALRTYRVVAVAKEAWINENHNQHINVAAIRDFGKGKFDIFPYLQRTNAKEIIEYIRKRTAKQLSEKGLARLLRAGKDVVAKVQRDFDIKEFVRTAPVLNRKTTGRR